MSCLPPAVEVLLQFRRLLDRLQSARGNDPTVGQYSGVEIQVLLHLTQPMKMKDMAELLFCLPSNVTALVDKLESAQLVVRQPCSDDRRSIQLVLTKKGEEVRAKVVEGLEVFIKAQTGLAEKDFVDILRILDSSDSTTEMSKV